MSQAGVYAENKMVWWYAREQKLPDAPKQVQLIISDLCNQDCSFCAYRMSGYTSNELFVGDSQKAAYGHNNPKRFIPTERALSLLNEMHDAGVLSIQFTGGGEPTVHPEHVRIFGRALALGLRCALVSNGVRWNNELIEEYLPEFDWVRVSIDASNPESYAETRRTPKKHWTQVWKNVGQLAEAIRRKKSKTLLGLGFVVTPDSYRDIMEFAWRAKSSGAQNVRFTAMFSPEDDKPFVVIHNRVRDLIDRARTECESDVFTIYDNFGSRFEDLKQHAPDYSFCSYQYYTAYVGGDMQAYRCCVLAYNKRGLVNGGDLSKRSFKEFWRSQGRKDDLANLNATLCERCQFNSKNRAMNDIIGEPPHKEWP